MRFLATFQAYDFLDTLVSLTAAFVLGTLIGAERQYRLRTAGSADQRAGGCQCRGLRRSCDAC